jgi:ATP-dependent Clp protease protease subunit
MKILVNFYANVTEKSVNDLIMFLTQAIARQNPQKPYDEIILQISSSGGSSDHGLLAFNFLKQIQIPKTTIGMGNVDSAAIMLFCSGDKRLTMPSCRFVLHQAMMNIGNGQFDSKKLTELGNITKRITEDYSSVVQKTSGQKAVTVTKKINDGTVLSSSEAKNFKLVTEIIDKPYLLDMKDLNILLIQNPQIIPPQQNNQPKMES